ncbi:DUF6090 family protein [Seonamhaeicola maritimus]|uniref:Uncharacterized protein n=1 Tax=Seonamhaeicola maritimus TaxID=2591822 RepID=A0A5C7GKA1_9FLAO|nr:DUF6090 family protein [Seonamhaeicola maritimus]TXG38712.1 hypothetical protein FUA22_02165 [Seonamhaeicola maritimus]
MIKFFRNIRKQLLGEGKTGHYLKYAIGEIVLVVIGILIALQINNWNEERKDRKTEIHYLHRLQEDFIKNQEQLNYQISFSQFQLDNVKLLLKSFDDPLQNDELILWPYALEHAYFLAQLTFANNTWSELKSTGNLELISNNKISQNVANCYSSISGLQQLNDEWSLTHLRYKDRINDLLSPKLRNRIMDNLRPTQILKPTDSILDLENYILKFKKIDGVQGDLGDILASKKVVLMNYDKLKISVENIIQIIKDELKTKTG